MLKLATILSVKNGFGLLEVLIASGIFIIVTGGTTSIVRTVLRNNQDSMKRTTAYNLAQEGLDLVKNISNNNLRDLSAATGWKHLKYERNELRELRGSDLSEKNFELFWRKFALTEEPAEIWRWVLESNSRDGDARRGKEHIFIQKDGEIRSNKCFPDCPATESGEIEYIRTIKFYQVRNDNNNTKELFAEMAPSDNDFVIKVEVRVRWNNDQDEVVASDFLTNWQS